LARFGFIRASEKPWLFDLESYRVEGDFMKVVSVSVAKAQFSSLLRRVALGEEITIAKRGVPIARLVPAYPAGGRRKLGFYAGRIWIADDFDASLADEVLDAFEGRAPGTRKKS
jgi:prevent-host-death family protein